MSNFIEQKDLLVLKKLGVNFCKDEYIFLLEIRKYLLNIWSEEYHNTIDNYLKPIFCNLRTTNNIKTLCINYSNIKLTIKTVFLSYNRFLNNIQFQIPLEIWILIFQYLPINKISLDEFNKLMCNYPSYGGRQLLDDAFMMNLDDNFNIFSDNSKIILNYIYNIII